MSTRLGLALGVTLATATAVWWLGASRVAIQSGGDTSLLAAQALFVLGVLRAMLIAVSAPRVAVSRRLLSRRTQRHSNRHDGMARRRTGVDGERRQRRTHGARRSRTPRRRACRTGRRSRAGTVAPGQVRRPYRWQRLRASPSPAACGCCQSIGTSWPVGHMRNPTTHSLFDAVRRRLLLQRLATALRGAAWATAAILIAMTLVHMFVARFDVTVVVAAAALPWLVAAGWSASHRITRAECAAWADRHLGGTSAYATLLETVGDQTATTRITRGRTPAAMGRSGGAAQPGDAADTAAATAPGQAGHGNVCQRCAHGHTAADSRATHRSEMEHTRCHSSVADRAR